MKNRYKLILGMMLLSIGVYGCTLSNVNDEKINNIDIAENLIADIKNNEESYFYLKDGILEESPLTASGSIRGYSTVGDITIFLEYYDNGKRINIKKNENLKSLNIDGTISTIKLSLDGENILLITKNENFIPTYRIINTHTLEETYLEEEIFISGDIINFLSNDELVFYGVDANKKLSGIFKYNLKEKEYELLREIKDNFVSYMKVLDENKIFISLTKEEENKIGLLDINQNSIIEMESEFEAIENVVLFEDKIYLSAKYNGNISLYCSDLKKRVTKRLTYDFPKQLARNSSFIIEDNKIYFSDENGILYFYDFEKDTTNILNNNRSYMIVDK
ncbi:MAG: hypothetical protein ACRC57_09335 [Sarcina sp.]